MTHPTRYAAVPPLADAVARISDMDLTRMCVAVNMGCGSALAAALAEVIWAARREVEPQGQITGGPK
jgi:hypothetical protein